jgi:HAD superfamily hydrolase (TIGR01509 family)
MRSTVSRASTISLPSSSPRSVIRGLIFDMGDVLFDATLWRRWLLQQVHRLGHTAGYDEFFGVWDRQFLEDVHRGLHQYQDAFNWFLLSQGLSRAQITEIQSASHIRRAELEAASRPFPGVRRTLGQLHANGMPMAVLSDSERTADQIAAALTRLGLGGYFRAIVSSVELGQVKPHPATYEAALRALRLPASAVAFIGHDAEELTGAAQAGCKTIAFNYESQARADDRLERFSDLPHMVAHWPALAHAG